MFLKSIAAVVSRLRLVLSTETSEEFRVGSKLKVVRSDVIMKPSVLKI